MADGNIEIKLESDGERMLIQRWREKHREENSSEDAVQRDRDEEADREGESSRHWRGVCASSITFEKQRLIGKLGDEG